MKIKKIAKMPVCICSIPKNADGIHESTLRSFHILERVKNFLQRGVPSDVILELINEMEENEES